MHRMAAIVPALILLTTFAAPCSGAEWPVRFTVTYDARIHPGPISGRAYVMLGPVESPREPRTGPDWFNPQPFFAVETRGWKPGDPLTFADNAIGFPGPLATLKPGKYKAQAVVRINPDTHGIGEGEGNAYGPVIEVEIGPDAPEPAGLTIDTVVPARPFEETDRLKLVDIESPLLSAFHKRPIRMRAGVVLPQTLKPGQKVPTLYVIPGFGGDHRMARMFLRGGRGAYAQDCLRVVLDPDCGTGHHVFADSAFNGPRGRALIEEMIPHIEMTFPAIAEPGARLLNGHSSGGWSSLWLQVTYPDFFGGTWSTSPDPVTFSDFQTIDLYAPGENTFRDRQGNRRPIARMNGKAALYVDHFAKMEDVIGDGGQLHSFEAVFSPLDQYGRPRPYYNRETGAVDPGVTRAWEKYDILRTLEKNWDTLGPRLKGKLHVYTGGEDTFYLEGAVKLLQASLLKLGSDASVEIIPGRDHGSILDANLTERLDREIKSATSSYRKD